MACFEKAPLMPWLASDLIVHAGDIGSPEILVRLGSIARTVVVRGNIDKEGWADHLPETEVVEVGQHALYVLHDIGTLDLDPVAAGFHAVIFGHSHRPSVEKRSGVLFLNPGSAGPRRFDLPISLMRLEITNSALEAELIELAK